MVAVAGGKAVVIAGGGGGGGGGAAGSVDGCGACCFEADPDAVKTEERWVYVGQGGGSYSQVSNMEMVGAGRGEFEKQKTTTVGGYRLRACALGAGCILLILVILLPIGFANGWWSQYRDPIIDNPCDVTPTEAIGQVPLTVRNRCCAEGDVRFCMTPTPAPDKVVVHDKYYTQVKNLKVPHMVPVPIPPPPRKVITHHVTVHTHAFDCDGDASGDTSTWSSQKQRYCCYLRGITCHTKVIYKPHYHTITHTKTVTVPVKTPIPAPPAQVVNKVVNVPIHDPPQVIKVPVPGKPEYVPKYVHQKHYVPVPEPSPPQYHNIPVPVKVKDPGQVIKVPVPLPPQTIVKNKVIYKTRHVKVQHIYDCKAGFNNWNAGRSSAKKSWCCSHESRGCPGDHSGSLTKTYVTHVTEGRPHTVYHTHHYVTHHVSHEYVPTHVVHHWGGSGHFGGDSYGSGSGATTVVHHYHSGSGSSGSSHSWGGSSGSSFGASPSFRGSKSFSGSHSFSSHSYGSSGSFGGGSHSYDSSGSFGGSHSFKGGSFGGSHVFGASHGGSMSGSHSSSGHFSFSTSSSSGDHAKHN